MDDLQDYVTNNMRRILKSEEKWNVLDREKKTNMTLKVSIKVRGPTSQLYILSKATIYDLFRVHERISRGGRL